jgi:ribosomal protein L15
MHCGHGKGPDLEAIKAGRLRLRLRCRRGLGRCSPHKGGRGQQGCGRDQRTTPKCNHYRAPLWVLDKALDLFESLFRTC